MNMYIQHRKIIGYDSEEKQWHVYCDESMVPKEPERKGVFYFGRYGVVAYTSTEEYQNSDGTIARDETKYVTKWNPETKEFYITGKEPRTIKIGGYGIGSYDPSEDADKW